MGGAGQAEVTEVASGQAVVGSEAAEEAAETQVGIAEEPEGTAVRLQASLGGALVKAQRAVVRQAGVAQAEGVTEVGALAVEEMVAAALVVGQQEECAVDEAGFEERLREPAVADQAMALLAVASSAEVAPEQVLQVE